MMPMTSPESMPTYSAIVCAYNEEKTIAGVLEALAASPRIQEIIAVDDGSCDQTPAIIQRLAQDHPQIHPIILPQNQGKGYAMAEGILHARGEMLLFVDADLLNLSPRHIAILLDAWEEGEADMIVGRRAGKSALPEFFDLTAPLSGERMLRRADILPQVPRIREARYGVETIINLYYRSQDKKVRYVTLHGLQHPIKPEKMALREAVPQYAAEGTQIGQALIFHYLNDWKRRFV
jgi:glycosyltransferase involved in cell wall biosynthesis